MQERSICFACGAKRKCVPLSSLQSMHRKSDIVTTPFDFWSHLQTKNMLRDSWLIMWEYCDICFGSGENRNAFHNPRCSHHCTGRALAINVPSVRPAWTNTPIQWACLDGYFHFSALSFHLKSDNETFISDGVWLSAAINVRNLTFRVRRQKLL